MLDYDKLLSFEPFSLGKKDKEGLYDIWLKELTDHHYRLCASYAALVDTFGGAPALPVRLFKEYDLRSIGAADVVKTMTSSGTTGQQVSKIYLDRETSARQSKALSRIVSSFIGKKRLPMLIVDSRAIINDRAMFSARGAGILGFSMLGRDVVYALDENMEIDFDVVDKFCADHKGEDVVLFGFTFMVWQHFCQALLKVGKTLELQGSLIHGGGWKKLIESSVDNDEFKRTVKHVSGIGYVYNYYGMVEQTGSIFMECEHGHLHASVLSDITTLDPLTLREIDQGRGIICTTSLLPTSYPGHVLLTEDEGEILGEDDCPCGRKGKYFTVYGRIKGAELRGCSDTHGYDHQV